MRKILFTIIMLVMLGAIISQGAPVEFIIILVVLIAISIPFYYIISDSHDTRMRGHKRGEKY